jgi:probable rRNA maturation factor
LPVRLHIEHGPHRGVSAREVLRRGRAIFEALQLGKAELSIVLTGDEQIRELNRLYRRRDRPTDVLAFAMRDGKRGEMPVPQPEKQGGELLGDVVVSVPRAREQARERSVPLIAELTMLVAHGALHLLGWDHDTPGKDRRMRAETDRLCALAARPRRAKRAS